jgi:hypothetical protein
MQREGFLASTFLIDIPRVMDTVYCARLDWNVTFSYVLW